MTVKGKPPAAPRNAAGSKVQAIRPELETVEPPEDWSPNSRYGLLRSDSSDSGRLARLEDVACWMACDLPREEVVNRIFSPLVIDAGDGHNVALYVVNSQSYAQRLIVDNRPNPRLSSFWQFFPEVESDSDAETVIRDVAEAWDRVWPGLSDPNTDHEARNRRAIERNKERDMQISWPEDEFLRQLIYRISVPVAEARSRWGYGRVAGAAAAKNVDQISTYAVEPPQGWEPRSLFGFMAFGVGPASRLVRLADVLRWLEQSGSLPRKAAVEALCKAMPEDVMTWLYALRLNDYAEPVPPDSTFGFKTAAQIEAKKAAHRQEVSQRELERERDGWWGRGHLFNEAGKIRTTWPEPTEAGLPALLKRIRQTWAYAVRNRAATCDVLDDPRSVLTALAVPLDKAHAAWGYGQVVAPVVAPEAASESGKKWTDEKLKQLLADHEELKRSGRQDYRKALAEKWGEGESNIKKQLSKARELAKGAASPFTGLGAKASR